MSTMLEQAFIDASALREAALKSAETEVISKYSFEIKEAVSKILDEAPEDEMDFEGAPEEELGAARTIDADLASTEGETLCACPDEEQEITVDVDELLAMADEMEPDIEPALQEKIEEGEKMPMKADAEDADEDGDTDDEVPAFLDEDIEIELDEDLLEKVNLDVRTSGKKGGWQAAADNLVEYEATLEAARLESTELEEEKAELEEANKDLTKENKEFRSVILQMKDKLEEVSLTNAKLLYTNRVLDSSSLNERQRKRIVESINKADSPNEAKVIYDTLQCAVGTTATGRTAPKSLSEAVSRPSSILSARRREEKVNPYADRMKILAGIKSSN